MEFRLSDEKVSNATDYRTIRSSYAGANGKAGGNWLDFKQWLLANGFSCSWADHVEPIVPKKENGGTALGQGVMDTIVGLNIDNCITMGLLDGKESQHTNAEGDSEIWAVYRGSPVSPFNDQAWGNYYNHILLVRPL